MGDRNNHGRRQFVQSHKAGYTGYNSGGKGNNYQRPQHNYHSDVDQMQIEPPYSVYVGGLHLDFIESDMDHIFPASDGFKVVSIRMNRYRDTDKFKGSCFVDFKDRESIVKALKLNGRLTSEKWGDTPLKINLSNRSRGGQVGGQGGPHAGRGGYQYGAARQNRVYQGGYSGGPYQGGPHQGGPHQGGPHHGGYVPRHAPPRAPPVDVSPTGKVLVNPDLDPSRPPPSKERKKIEVDPPKAKTEVKKVENKPRQDIFGGAKPREVNLETGVVEDKLKKLSTK